MHITGGAVEKKKKKKKATCTTVYHIGKRSDFWSKKINTLKSYKKEGTFFEIFIPEDR